MEKKMMINDMIASAKYYFYAKANQPKENRNLYWKEVTEEGKVTFEKVIFRGYKNKEMYYSSDRRHAMVKSCVFNL